MKNYDVIYSIGSHCVCASYLNKFNLRKHSGPFDWITHNINFKYRIEMILNDFENFLNIDDLKFLPKDPNVINDSKCDYYENVRTNLRFFHDFPMGVPLATSFPDVKEKYDRRIKRFLNDLKSNKKVLLVWFSHIPTIENEEAISLCKAVCKKFKKTIDFLIIEHDENKKKNEIETLKLSKNITKQNLYTVSYDENGQLTCMGREDFCSQLFKDYKLRIPLKEIIKNKLNLKINFLNKNMQEPRLLTHIHVYYHEQVDYILSKIKNISNVKNSLYVTYTDYNENTIKKIKRFNKYTHFIKVNNIGYDVYPFLVVLNQVNLSDFDYILKLHTKGYQNIKKTNYYGYKWRNNCFDALIKNSSLFNNNIKLLESNKKIGMIGSQKFLFPINDSSPESTYLFDDICQKLCVNIKKGMYISGTMFLCRAQLMQMVKNFNLSETDFQKSICTTDSGTLAHVMERMLCSIIEDQGYIIKGIENTAFKNSLQIIFSIKNENIRKVITILGIKFKFKSKQLLNKMNSDENSFAEDIFSVKNDDIRKVITIVGIKIKIKSQKLINRKKIHELETQYNELNNEYNNTKNELNTQINKYNELNNEYEQYKQQQIIDKQEADNERGQVYKNPINLDLAEPRTFSVNWISENAKVLDVGCACGELGEKLKEIKNSEVIGLEYNSASIDIAEQNGCYKNIIQCDLNKYKNIPLENNKFDYIVCGDVLEHIHEPAKVIEHLKQYLNDNGYFILSIPNIAHASIKANLLLDNFDYTTWGLLDQTHIKFFTHKTIVNFLSDLRLEIEDCKLTNFWGINGSQNNNPYPELPQEIREFILKDKHSSIVQYVVKCKKNEKQDLMNINSEKIQTELNNTPYMQGVEEYLK